MKQQTLSKARTAAITGANGTLGMAFTRGLAEAGYAVVMLVRRVAESREAIRSLLASGYAIEVVSCDVLDRAAVERALGETLANVGTVDVLVNCAGGNQAGATVMPDAAVFDLSVDALRQVTDLNLLGTMIPSLVFAKAMSERGSGCIVNVSSMAASQPLTRVVGYSAAKAAVDNFTKWLAVELAQKYGAGLRVNAIAPGFFLAEQNRRLLTEKDGSLTARGQTIISQTPMGRFGDPEELLSTLLWLCDPASSFVTGIVVPVDGGFSAFSGV